MKYLNWAQVHDLTGGKSRTTIWRWEKAGWFPKRRQLGPNSVAWLKDQVDHWTQSREVVKWQINLSSRQQ